MGPGATAGVEQVELGQLKPAMEASSGEEPMSEAAKDDHPPLTAVEKWWRAREYAQDPFCWVNAGDISRIETLDPFETWHIDPSTEDDLGVSPTLDEITSLGTSEPVIVYAPRGGGKTFYRRFAAQQIRHYSEHSTHRGVVAIEIEDLGEKLGAEPELSGETIARLIYHVLCTELKVSESARGLEHMGAILQKCDEAVKAAGRPMAYVLVDDVRQLFSTNAADAEKNQRALAALVEFLHQAVGRSAGKPLALRVFLPLALQRAIDNCHLQGDRWPRQRVITWRPRRCQAVAVRRLDTCWTNKKADMAAGLGRLFTTEALTEFERWLDELPFVSPRCVIWTLNRLALHACSAGVTTELLGADLWQQFIEQPEWQRDCHPEPEYPFNVQYNLEAIRELLLDAFTAKELKRLLQFAPHADLVKLLDELSSSASKSDIVDEIIPYCCRLELMAELLQKVKAMRPRKYARYEQDLFRS